MSARNIRIHIPFGKGSAMGPGKADLLEAIHTTGSISAAGRRMDMSYKRAWDLMDTMNHRFKEPLVVTATGGSRGGGTQVTAFGLEVLRRYRNMEARAGEAITEDIQGLLDMVSPQPD